MTESAPTNIHPSTCITNIPVEAEGLTLLATGGDNPLFDIVFIHGLQGHPEHTWTHVEKVQREESKDSDDSGTAGNSVHKSIFRKGFRSVGIGKQTEQREVRTFWPRDILPNDFPRARILTYGYASQVSCFFGKGKPNHDNLTENGRRFLNALAAERYEEQGRPLIILTHSLGGLIVKSVRLANGVLHLSTLTYSRLSDSPQQKMVKTTEISEIYTIQLLRSYFSALLIEAATGQVWVNSWRSPLPSWASQRGIIT